MSGRRKRVQVGWYCDHEHEPWDARTAHWLSRSMSIETPDAA